MQEHYHPTTEMVRIPGLYRPWELSEVVQGHRALRIEDAGAHQDGTPLVAIYAVGAVPAATDRVPPGSVCPVRSDATDHPFQGSPR